MKIDRTQVLSTNVALKQPMCCLLQFLCMGNFCISHPHKYPPTWWGGNPDQGLYLSSSIFALSGHSAVNPSSLQSLGEAKKIREATSKLICLGHQKLCRESRCLLYTWTAKLQSDWDAALAALWHSCLSKVISRWAMPENLVSGQQFVI